ncbi:TPA: peptidylprolyl isomerase [Enterococcus faecium]|nr:peptidylprolyl isomerase [Enterococcus faecium]HCI0837364.1 peptidylprolyl isomerase [Enterococcus faecium]HCI0974633.1 peptidylprolyl isomerase [Enterococcus faecium]HCI1585459.1 peptidylprolyl isomerase [Enterococcus faecium]
MCWSPMLVKFRLRLFPDQAPLAVANWRSLAEQGVYDNTPFGSCH